MQKYTGICIHSVSIVQLLGVKKWCSANFVSNTKQKNFGSRTCKVKGFWLCCKSILFSRLSELRFIKWVRFFEQNCIVKWMNIFSSFCWLWDFLLEKNKNKKKCDNVHWNVWTNIEKLNTRNRNNIFKKKAFKISKYEILNHSYFGPNFVF